MDTASYLGGLVTGEGCFCFAVQRIRGNKLRITPIFAMFMNDRVTIDAAADGFRSLDLPVYLQERPKAGIDQYGINIGGLKRNRRICEALIPYLTGQKRRAAEIMLAFINSREAQRTGAPYSEAELDMVRELRGVNGNTKGRKNPL